MAARPPQANDVLSGLLVSKDYSYTLLDPRDLRDFAGLTTCIVTQRQKVVLTVGWDLVRWHLEGMYGRVEEGVDKDGVPTLRVRFTHASSLLANLIENFTIARSWVPLMSSKFPSMK